MFFQPLRGLRARWLAGLCLASAAVGSSAAPNPSWALDVAGGSDHPLIQRYKDSWLIAYQQQAFDSTSFPGKLGLKNQQFLAPVTVEGRITRLVYFAPLGKSRLEVHRNYEQALQRAGFKTVTSCGPQQAECENIRYGFDSRYARLKEADFGASRERQKDGTPLERQMGSLGGINMLGTEDFHFSYGTLSQNGQTVHVMLHTGKVYNTDFTTTYLEIAEPQAMSGGQVTVNADALRSGLQADGRIALYGIYFDTGRSQLKPESQAQLQQIASLLKAQPALKVVLVGHTDNQGALEANLQLSQQRAQAVVDALVAEHQIDGRRLLARGVASLAPVASNAAEAGRARNRRVELVQQ